MTETVKPAELSQEEIIAELKGLWEKNQEAIGLFSEALSKDEVVVTFRCGDARDVKNIGSAVKDLEIPWEAPVKSISGYPRPSFPELLNVSNGAGLIEITSHHDPQGLLIGDPKIASICGGQDAMFSFYTSPDYQGLFNSYNRGEIPDVEFDKQVRKFVNAYTNELDYHGVPLDTAKSVVVDLFWHRSPTIAWNFWDGYLSMYEGGERWKQDLKDAVVHNVDAFQDPANVGLDAFVRAWTYANLLADAGVSGKWLSVGLVNHRVQATVPLAIIGTADRLALAFLPGDKGFNSVGTDQIRSLDEVIQGWKRLVFKDGELGGLSVEEMTRHDKFIARYYRFASLPTEDRQVIEATESQGDFLLTISAVKKMNPIVYAGGVLKHQASFGVTVMGETDKGLSYHDRHALDHLGYGPHLGTKGMVVFADSEREGRKILEYIFLERWGKDYDHKDCVVVMVVEPKGKGWQASYFGTKITGGSVELVQKGQTV